MTKEITDVVRNGTGPWWLKAAYNLGIPAVIAMLLIGFVTTSLATGLKDIQASQAAIIANQATIMDGLADAQQLSAEACFILRQVCINTAKDEAQRSACISYRIRP